MSASDGTLNEVSEDVTATLDTASLSHGYHILLVRGQDASGYWGPFTAAWLDIVRTWFFPIVMMEH